jgi:hypothetical protein
MAENALIAHVDNLSPEPAAVTQAKLTLEGLRGGSVVTANVALDPVQVLPGTVSLVAVPINPWNWPADHYRGVLRLAVAGADRPVSVDLSLDVRSSPWWALLAATLGVFAGAAVHLFGSARLVVAQWRAGLLARWGALGPTIAQIADQTSRVRAEEQWRQVERGIQLSWPSQPRSATQLAALEDRIAFLLDVQKHELAAAVSESPDLQTRAATLAAQARSAAWAGDTAAANQHRQNLVYLTAAPAPAGETLDTATDATSQPAPSSSISEPPAVDSRESNGNLGTLRSIRHQMYFIILYSLFLVLGVWLLYVQAGATFGAGGLVDALPFVLWGFTAETVRRTLSGALSPPLEIPDPSFPPRER